MGTLLPSDIFYGIVLHLPHTRDILALALTNRSVRAALSISTLLESRDSLHSKDETSAWQDEDDSAQLSGDCKHWMIINYTYSRTLRLFE
jgi:hypothetical protein